MTTRRVTLSDFHQLLDESQSWSRTISSRQAVFVGLAWFYGFNKLSYLQQDIFRTDINETSTYFFSRDLMKTEDFLGDIDCRVTWLLAMTKSRHYRCSFS